MEGGRRQDGGVGVLRSRSCGEAAYGSMCAKLLSNRDELLSTEASHGLNRVRAGRKQARHADP